MEDEAEVMFNRVRHFKHGKEEKIEWNRREKEIELIRVYCTYDRIKKFYRKLFAISETYDSNPLKTSLTIEEKKNADMEDLKLYREANKIGPLAKFMVDNEIPLDKFKKEIRKSKITEVS